MEVVDVVDVDLVVEDVEVVDAADEVLVELVETREDVLRVEVDVLVVVVLAPGV